ncbi:lin-18 [Pristionchus pacificus]|uniref:Receptor tyrosine kinase-like protein n=1 Tax=Pristionchus pacificus TaxID=54126 RepID=Q52ZF0_PRIPA|nr:receptor tyrosine kinase-like protein [Pristionchus pacificus]KAF8384411.1 lin-18 [Pristionchus pacificus]
MSLSISIHGRISPPLLPLPLLPSLLLLLLSLPLSSSSINLLITKAEMNRTLGVNAELAYIENGEVNNYSTKYAYRVDSHVGELKFTWNAPTNNKIHYSMQLDSDPQVVAKLRHSPSGFLPRNPSEFSIEYRCAGTRSGQFEVVLTIEFTHEDSKTTRVRLRQEKICAIKTRGELHREEDVVKPSDEIVSSQSIFYFIIGAAALFLSLIFFLLFLYFRGSRKDERTETLPSRSSRFASSFRSSVQSRQPFLTSTPNKSKNTSSLRPIGPSSSLIEDKNNEVNVKKTLIELYADRNLFQMIPFVEMEGSYSETRWAIWRQNSSGECGDIDDEEDEGTSDEAMIVKTLKANANKSQFDGFLLDAFAFHNLPPHPNLAQVAAAASYGRFENPETVKDMPLICYRHRGFGNLRKFLLSCRSSGGEERRSKSSASSSSGGSGGHTLRTHELVSIAVQATRAVAHLHKYGVLHKDIAARNCIVSENAGAKNISERLLVQLVDSSLSRDLFPSDYSLVGDELLPIKWMAIESIASRNFSSATDIWSLGVLIWELLSCDAPPFPDLPSDQLLGRLQIGERLPQPYNCPDQLYGIMQSCWQSNARDRPNAVQLLTKLVEFNVTLNKYI